MGLAPVAGKTAIDAETAKIANVAANGLGDASSRLITGVTGFSSPESWSKSVLGAAEHVRLFGVPDSVDFRIRDDARNVHALDPDIACKRSWSMSVKIMTQRQRNYDRAIERLKSSGAIERKRQALTALLGFEWPW